MATTLINQLVENMVESLVEEVTKRVLIHFDTLSLRLQVLERAESQQLEFAELVGRLNDLEKMIIPRVERLEERVNGIQNDFVYDVNAIIRTRFYEDEIPDEGRVQLLIEQYSQEEDCLTIEDVIELINDRVRITVE